MCAWLAPASHVHLGTACATKLLTPSCRKMSEGIGFNSIEPGSSDTAAELWNVSVWTLDWYSPCLRTFCFLDNSSLLVAEADKDEWEYHNEKIEPWIWILAVLTLIQPWPWGATVLTTTTIMALAIYLRLQPQRRRRLAHMALRISKRRYAYKATQQVLDLKAYAYHLALCKAWGPTRFHGGAGGSRTTERKRQQKQQYHDDLDDADTLCCSINTTCHSIPATPTQQATTTHSTNYVDTTQQSAATTY